MHSPGLPTPSAAAATGIGLGDGASTKVGQSGQSSEGAALALPPGPRRPWTGIRKVSLPSPAGLRLHTADGARKYVTAGEREMFLREAERADRLVRTPA
jgi:hypothetical protein